jgi:hypothetical protein
MSTILGKHLQRRYGTLNSSRELVVCVGNTGIKLQTAAVKTAQRKKKLTSPKAIILEESKNVTNVTKLDT